MINTKDSSELLRVSVATYNQVIFPHPQNQTLMLALERKATVRKNSRVSVRAQPFGGAIRILDPEPLQKIIGQIQFDSERTKHDRDFRILIPQSKWEPVKEYCLLHLRNPDDVELESTPHRELVEEFKETINVHLQENQYKVQPMGFVIEDTPVRTNNLDARGHLTIRLYRTFKAQIVDSTLSEAMLAASENFSDHDLEILALEDFQNGGKGHAHSVLTVPLNLVVESFLTLSPDLRFRKILVKNHTLDKSVLSVLENVDIPQYQRFEEQVTSPGYTIEFSLLPLARNGQNPTL